MTTTESNPQLHVDDVCTSNSSNQLAVGYVDRTHAEIESHTPYPTNTYGKVHRHKAVPRQLYKEFLRDGVPPPGFVLMQWQTESKAELVPCSDLLLLDRSFMSGDLVRKGNRSGTVVSTRTRCTLLSMCDVRETKSRKIMKCAWLPLPAEEEPPLELVNDGGLLYDIPASELKLVQTFNEGDIIIYKNWIGRIKDCFDEVTVRLTDNGVVSIADEGKLEPMSGDPEERFAVGSLVKTKKGVLRTGRWVFGTYSPNTPPIGVVVDVRTKECQVDWLHPRMGMASEVPIWSSAPEGILGPDELESDEVRLYDISKLPMQSSLTAARSDPELQGGLRVRFKDLPAACAKYNGSDSHGKLEKLDRTQSLGYDLNVFTITSTTTAADVLWSDDSTIETVRTTSIIPDPSIDDEDAVFAGEVVCTNETREPPPEAMTSWAITPARVGIADRVNNKDRVAHITWFKDSTLSFCDKSLDLLVPSTKLGSLGGEQEEVSFYDIRAPKSVNRNRGDYVLLLKIPHLDSTAPNSVNWFGEVVDLGRNGKCIVRLGAAEPVQEVECDITDTAPAMNLDVEDHPPDVDGNEDYEFSDEIEDIDFEMGHTHYSDSESEEDIWFEDGQDIPIDDADDSWSTEDEDNSDAMSTQDDTPATNIVPPSVPVALSTQAPVGSADQSTDQKMSNASTEELRLSSLPNAPAAYEILESEVPSGHHYLLQNGSTSAHHMKGVSKEHKILSAPGALPEGVYVRTWESRMDLIRVLFVGPLGTPYEYAPFMIDLHLPSQYPYEPPKAFFHSWTAEGAGMAGRVNPNLYEEGKICLSLLGTWQGDEARNEAWTPNQSTVLQVLVSILGLVLVREPYYNEAGFEPLQGLSSINQNSVAYTERTYLRARAFLISPVSRLGRGETAGLEGLEHVLRWLYTDADGARLLPKAISAAHTILKNSEDGAKVEVRDGLSVVSRGAALPLKRVVTRLEQLDQEASSQIKN